MQFQRKRSPVIESLPSSTYSTVSIKAVECDSAPEVPVAVIVYVRGAWPMKPLMEPQPLSPAIAAMPDMSNNSTETSLPSRLPLRRSMPAKGNSRNANESGASLPMLLPAGCAAAEARGNCMVSVTVVVPDPAGTLAGEKTAVASAGSPVADNAMAYGKAPAPFAGLTVKVTTAVPPDGTVAELLAPLATLMVKSGAAGSGVTVSA